MTGEQMPRGARAPELDALRAPLWFIAAFEDGKATPDFRRTFSSPTKSICAALEAAGVEFIAENEDGPDVIPRKA